MGLRRTIERRLRERQARPSAVIPPLDVARIDDGVNYTLPLNLPHYLRDSLTSAGKLTEYVQDYARALFRFQFDTPTQDPDLSIVTPTEDPLTEWRQTTRRYVLSNCHAAADRNPIAKRAIGYMSSFVIGDGFNLVVKNPEVETFLQAFIDDPDNAIREYERQALKDLLTDGELFLRCFTGSGDSAGMTVVVPIRPWEIQYIHTEPQFIRRRLLYRWQPYTVHNPDDPYPGQIFAPEDIPAADMLHVAINRRSYELRGRPELYAVLPWLKAYKDWLENRARQNYWRGALLWWVKIKAAAGVVAQKAIQYSRPPTPGSIAVTSENEEWQALNAPVAAGDAAEDGRQIKLMTAVGFGLPEYFLGDGENANLASSKSQQLPALTTFSEMQSVLREQLWVPLFRKVLENAVKAGDLPLEVDIYDAEGEQVLEPDDAATDDAAREAMSFPRNPTQAPPLPDSVRQQLKPQGTPKKCSIYQCFEIEYPELGDKDTFTLAQGLKVAADMNWVSRQTAQTEMGWDSDLEDKRIQRERVKDRDAMAQGLIPTPMEYGFGADAQDDEQAGEKQGEKA